MTNVKPAEQFSVRHGAGSRKRTIYSDYGHCYYFKQDVVRNSRGKEVGRTRRRITKAEFEAARNA